MQPQWGLLVVCTLFQNLSRRERDAKAETREPDFTVHMFALEEFLFPVSMQYSVLMS